MAMNTAARHPGGPRTISNFDPAAFRGDRLDAGLSMSELARRAGVSHSILADWEAGKHRPTPWNYRRVLAVLLDAEEQAPPDWIWRRHLEVAS